jgi:hypothetical protein
MTSASIEVRRGLSEVLAVIKDIGGDHAPALMEVITTDKEVDGIRLIRRMLELGVEPKKVRDLLGIAWGLPQEDVQRILEAARKPEVEDDAELRIAREGSDGSGETEEDEAVEDLGALLKSGAFDGLDDPD